MEMAGNQIPAISLSTSRSLPSLRDPWALSDKVARQT